MRRRDLMRRLRDIALEEDVDMEVTEGGRHTKVKIGNRQTAVPRHNEINEHTARSIIKHMEGKP
jgi:mRNA interferase HicA